MHRLVDITSRKRPYLTCLGAKSLAYQLSEADAARFWVKVGRRGADDCWLWTASLIGRPGARYGQFSVEAYAGRRRTLYAHRVAWELVNGPIPEGGAVLHTCDVTRCVNPNHLRLGTQDANMKDAAAKGRLNVHRPNHCRLKLTQAQVSELRNLRAAGMTRTDLASRYGITVGYVSTLLTGKRRVYTAPQLQVRAEGAA